MRGFPIRTSWSHRLVINSTRLIADSHVLHRLLLPRHPPCALANFPNHHPQQVAARQAQHEHHTTNHNTTCRVKRCGHTTITIKRHTPPQKGQDATLDTIYKKMLASTIQLQSTTPRHHQPPRSPDHGPPAAGHQKHHHPPHPPTRALAASDHLWLFQNPTVCQNHPRTRVIITGLHLPTSMTTTPANQYYQPRHRDHATTTTTHPTRGKP